MSDDRLATAITNINKYTSNADEALTQAIIKHLGIALQSKDASLVSCSDPSELERVRESLMKKKLGLTDSDDVLDAAIKDICETMKDSRQKSRITFYYLLTEKLGKQSAFV